jgi:hypothetical protein
MIVINSSCMESSVWLSAATFEDSLHVLQKSTPSNNRLAPLLAEIVSAVLVGRGSPENQPQERSLFLLLGYASNQVNVFSSGG